MVRSFAGIPVEGEAADALQAAQARLPSGRLVPRENFHITLAFLGEHPMPVVEDVHYALARLAPPAFSWAVAGLDLLGPERAQAVVALVVPSPALKHLRDRVLEAARGTGLVLPRARFTPHVTLARLGAATDREERERVARAVVAGSGFAAGPFPAERFALFRSHLARSGAIYEEMADYALGPAQAGLAAR